MRLRGVPHLEEAGTAGRVVEPTVVRRAPWNVREVTLGDGEYYVIGDNRAMTAQNHDFGLATIDRIIGKMLF